MNARWQLIIVAAMVAGGCARSGGGTEVKGMNQKVMIVEFADSGERKGVVTVDRIVKTDAEWKKQLTPEQFRVTRGSGTEPAFCGGYLGQSRRRHLPVRLLRDGAVQVRCEI